MSPDIAQRRPDGPRPEGGWRTHFLSAGRAKQPSLDEMCNLSADPCQVPSSNRTPNLVPPPTCAAVMHPFGCACLHPSLVSIHSPQAARVTGVRQETRSCPPRLPLPLQKGESFYSPRGPALPDSAHPLKPQTPSLCSCLLARLKLQWHCCCTSGPLHLL